MEETGRNINVADRNSCITECLEVPAESMNSRPVIQWALLSIRVLYEAAVSKGQQAAGRIVAEDNGQEGCEWERPSRGGRDRDRQNREEEEEAAAKQHLLSAS